LRKKPAISWNQLVEALRQLDTGIELSMATNIKQMLFHHEPKG